MEHQRFMGIPSSVPPEPFVPRTSPTPNFCYKCKSEQGPHYIVEWTDTDSIYCADCLPRSMVEAAMEAPIR